MIAGLAIAMLGLGGVGCVCTTESRSIHLEASGTAGAAATRASFELYEHRGGTGNAEFKNGKFSYWYVYVTPYPGDTVVTVSLLAGTLSAPGALLYDLPLQNENPEAGGVTRLYTMIPYQGAVPFDELWDRFQEEPTFIEIALAGGADPIGIGPLEISHQDDWHDVCD